MTRKLSKAARKLADADYLQNLSKEDRNYYEKFEREFYDANFSHSDPIHQEHHKKELTASKYARRNDIFNKGTLSRPDFDAFEHKENEDEIILDLKKYGRRKTTDKIINEVTDEICSQYGGDPEKVKQVLKEYVGRILELERISKKLIKDRKNSTRKSQPSL